MTDRPMTYLVTRYDFKGDKASPRAPVEFADVEAARAYCKLVRAAIAKWGDDSGASLTDRCGNNIKVE